MPQQTTDLSQLSWLFNQLRDETGGVRHALLLSADGLKLARDDSLGVDQADRLAALSSGLSGLARESDLHFDGGGHVRTVLIEMPKIQLLMMAAGPGTTLAVVADAEADPGTIGGAMTDMIKKLTEHLGVAPRTVPGPTP